MKKKVKAAGKVPVPVLFRGGSCKMLYGLIHVQRFRKPNQAFKNTTCCIKIHKYIPAPVALVLLAT